MTLAAAPASSASGSRACPQRLAGPGFWVGLRAAGVGCAGAHGLANHWIARFQTQINMNSRPRGVRHVSGYACELTLYRNGRKGRVTCRRGSRRVVFHGPPDAPPTPATPVCDELCV